MYNDIIRIPLKWNNLVQNIYGHEPGWVVMNHFFSHCGGFFMMVAIINIVINSIFFSFIRDNVNIEYWGLSMMIYLMSSSLYVVNFSLMRQGLTIALFVFSWKFIKKKKFLPALVVILVASTIHSSAQVLIPFAFFGFLPFGKRLISVFLVLLIIILYLNKDLLTDLYSRIVSIGELASTQSLEYYEQNNDTTIKYGVGFYINMIPFIIAMWGLSFRGSLIDNQKKMLITLSMFSFVIAPFGQILPIVGRFGMYFNAFGVAAIPYIYSLLPNKRLYSLLISVYLMMLVYGYISFFLSPIWIQSYSTFHSIFEVL